jgi:hypothetical protein
VFDATDQSPAGAEESSGGSHRVAIAVLVDDLIRRTWTCNDYDIATAYELAENVARYARAEGLDAGYWVARDVLTL